MTCAPVSAAILAGGLATRLRSLTETIPKSLIDVNGEPFIAHQLRLLRENQIERVVLCVGHLGERIQEAIGDGARFDLHVEYSFDGPKLMGTAGALKCALPLLLDDFLVLYGDSYLDFDYQAAWRSFQASNKLSLMTVFANEGRWEKSNVEYDGVRIVSYDKQDATPQMRHVDYGLGIFKKEAFTRVPTHQAHDLAQLYQDMLKQDQLAAFEVRNRFYEIGSVAGLQETREYLAARSRRSMEMSYSSQYLTEARQILDQLDLEPIERMALLLAETREKAGRLFILGVGGGAGHASHAVNDFRKIANIEAYAPTDNVSELTARINDDGWSGVFENWLRVSRLREDDLILVFSVGGGNLEKNVSPNLVAALKYAQEVGARIAGIVGRDGGFTAQVADACVIVPTINSENVTPHTEAFQAVVWHLLVSHPILKQTQTKWESIR